MLNPTRLFAREEPSRDAKLFIIYCEGKNREPNYFKFFNRLSSQIRFEIIGAEQHGSNSPTGLLAQAKMDLIESSDNPDPKYELDSNDEVWFVIDTDTWGKKIDELRGSLIKRGNWFVAQSNPCFEVWLYYHFRNKVPTIHNITTCKSWKMLLPDEIITGGFDSRRHSVFIEDAIINARKCYKETNFAPDIGTTEVFKLARNFFPMVKEKIDSIKEIISQSSG